MERGGGRVLNEANLLGLDESLGSLEQIISREPTPEFAVEFGERCELLLEKLSDIERETAELKLQGYSNREVADRLGCGLRTVGRRLAAIRLCWTADLH